jgi:imidazolonepropionase-like amidohydrolase
MGFEPGMGSNAFELEIYVGLGMKPMDAILTVTRNAAKALKMDRDLGTLEAGKIADIVAVDGDPLADIRILKERKRIQLVMKSGEIYVDRRPGHSREVIHAEPDTWRKIDG